LIGIKDLATIANRADIENASENPETRLSNPSNPSNRSDLGFGLNSLIASNEESFEKILLRMLDSKDIEPKTQIDNVRALTKLAFLSDWLKSKGYLKSAQSITDWIKKYLIYQVSRDRQSRKEVERILTEGLKREKSLAEKLTEKPT